MTEKDYISITNRLNMCTKIRDDAEELIRNSSPKDEIKKILFVSELVKQYAESIIEDTKDSEDTIKYLIFGNANGLKSNINRTIIRLKTYLSEYDPEKIL